MQPTTAQTPGDSQTPIQITPPPKKSKHLLIKIIIGGVVVFIVGFIFLTVMTVTTLYKAATHRDTPEEKAAACRILTSAIYDIEQALDKENITERGVSYKCEGTTLEFNHNRGIVSYWSREVGDREKAEVNDCTSIINKLAVFRDEESKKDISAMCGAAETIDGRIAIRITMYASSRTGNLPPERTVAQKPDPTDLSQYDLSKKYVLTYQPAGKTLNSTKNWILYRDDEGQKVFATLEVYSNAIAVSPKKFGGVKCSESTADSKCTLAGKARDGKPLYAVKGIDGDSYYTVREATVDFIVIVSDTSPQSTSTDEIVKIFDGIAPNSTP